VESGIRLHLRLPKNGRHHGQPKQQIPEVRIGENYREYGSETHIVVRIIGRLFEEIDATREMFVAGRSAAKRTLYA
jgi:hypothetical protein